MHVTLALLWVIAFVWLLSSLGRMVVRAAKEDARAALRRGADPLQRVHDAFLNTEQPLHEVLSAAQRLEEDIERALLGVRLPLREKARLAYRQHLTLEEAARYLRARADESRQRLYNEVEKPRKPRGALATARLQGHRVELSMAEGLRGCDCGVVLRYMFARDQERGKVFCRTHGEVELKIDVH